MEPGLRVAGSTQVCSLQLRTALQASHWREKGHSQGGWGFVVVTVGP